jgi:hypothetical protein
MPTMPARHARRLAHPFWTSLTSINSVIVDILLVPINIIREFPHMGIDVALHLNALFG